MKTYTIQFRRNPNDQLRTISVLAISDVRAIMTAKECEGKRILISCCIEKKEGDFS